MADIIYFSDRPIWFVH